MNIHIQALISLLASATCGFTGVVVNQYFGAIYDSAPFGMITEIAIVRSELIYWILFPAVIVIAWILVWMKGKKNEKALHTFHLITIIAILLLAMGIRGPASTTTFELSAHERRAQPGDAENGGKPLGDERTP